MQEVIYILVSPEVNAYTQMTYISILSLKQTNPTWKVSLASDSRTISVLEQTKCLYLLDLVDNVIPFDINYKTASIGSRIIKTQLASKINRPFCFFDSDLIIRKPIKFNFEKGKSLAAALNHSRRNFKEQIFDRDLNILEQMGWQDIISPYINSGVLFFDGSTEASELSVKWHYYWRQTSSKTTQYADQPSLYKALSESPNILQILPNDLNAQIKSRLWFPAEEKDITGKSTLDHNAVIWHYYASLGDPEIITQYEYLLNKYPLIGIFPEKEIRKLINRKIPWRYHSLLDKRVVNATYKHPKIKGFYKLWLNNKKLAALKYLIYKYLYAIKVGKLS